MGKTTTKLKYVFFLIHSSVLKVVVLLIYETLVQEKLYLFVLQMSSIPNLMAKHIQRCTIQNPETFIWIIMLTFSTWGMVIPPMVSASCTV